MSLSSTERSLLLVLTTIVSPCSFATFNLSPFPATCFMEHMDPDMDIIFIELAINDQRVEEQAEAYEWLLRALLALPTKPAVIHVQTFGLIFQMLTTGGDLHTGIAQYYDNPIISIRNVLLPHILAQKDPIDVIKHWFGKVSYTSDDPDMRHVSICCGHCRVLQPNHSRSLESKDMRCSQISSTPSFSVSTAKC